MLNVRNCCSVCIWPDLDFEELSSSRQSIEERLVEEYRNSSYFSDTRVELDRIVQDKEFVMRPQSHIITYNSSFMHQLRWVLKRTFQNLMLNPQISVAQVYSTLLSNLKYKTCDDVSWKYFVSSLRQKQKKYYANIKQK